MSLATAVRLLVNVPDRLLGRLDSLLLLAVRVWIGWEFFKSGWLKLSSWGSTLFLFELEYRVPLLPPYWAALLGTAGELVFPVLLWVGIAGRLSALGLSAVNVMAVVAYAHVLYEEGFEAALGQHYLWGFALLVLVVLGPGRLSFDHLVLKRAGSPRPMGAPAHAH